MTTYDFLKELLKNKCKDVSLSDTNILNLKEILRKEIKKNSCTN